jgi:hypothetical protein
MTKGNQVKYILNNILIEEENDWDSKQRELFTMKELLKLDWLNDGAEFLVDKKFKKRLRDCYFNYKQNEITSNDLPSDYYVIHEPFGSKSSPDYLFITPNGIFGIEDKSSKTGKIVWNTGTPGNNKIITYFDSKIRKVYILTSYEYKWGHEIDIRYKKFTQKIIKFGDEEFKKDFADDFNHDDVEFYARPMLNHKKKIMDIFDSGENNVNKILNEYLGKD